MRNNVVASGPWVETRPTQIDPTILVPGRRRDRCGHLRLTAAGRNEIAGHARFLPLTLRFLLRQLPRTPRMVCDKHEHEVAGDRRELNPYVLEFEMAYAMKSNSVILEVQIIPG